MIIILGSLIKRHVHLPGLLPVPQIMQVTVFILLYNNSLELFKLQDLHQALFLARKMWSDSVNS